MYKRFLLFIMMLLFVMPIVVQGQSGECAAERGFVYDAETDILELIHWSTGERTIAQENVRDFDVRQTSLDCRFIVGSVWRDYTGTERIHESIVGDTTVWNALTGEQYHIFEDAHRVPHRITWSPDSERLIVYTRNGIFLWNFFTNQRTLLTPPSNRWYISSQWSFTDHHELFVLPYTYDSFSSQTVYLYNWLSGKIITTFDIYVSPQIGRELNDVWLTIGYRVDERFIYVYRRVGSPFYSPIKIYDRNSYQLLYSLNGGSNGAVGRQLIEISPDGHYLTIGFRTLRVWDLWNLPENFEDRTATYQYSIDDRGMNQVRFIDNTIVEMILDDGNLLRMNVETGERLD